MTKKSLNTSQESIGKQSNSQILAVEAYIDEIFNSKQALAAGIGAPYSELVHQVHKLISRGGKRVRPQLVINTYEAFGGQDKQAIIKAASSQELFHAFALVHDDIIDRDLLRWGGPNISGVYFNSLKQKLGQADARHFADAWSLMAGDIYLGLCFEALSCSGFSAAKVLRAQKLVQETLFLMVGGEVMDVASPIYGLDTGKSSEQYFTDIYMAKTSAYSFSMPLRLGAMLAGASSSSDKLLKQFGDHTGVAFQIKDDILGIFGDEAKLGKSSLSDIREGKITLLMHYGLELASPIQKKGLLSILGNHNASRQDLVKVQKILKSSGALHKTELAMLMHTEAARNIILKSSLPMSLNGYLADLLAFSIKRTR